jgi:hypothetical protein
MAVGLQAGEAVASQQQQPDGFAWSSVLGGPPAIEPGPRAQGDALVHKRCHRR